MLFFVLFISIRLTEPSEIICQQLVDLYEGLGRQKSDPREFFGHLRFIRCLLQDFRMMVSSDDLRFRNVMQSFDRLDRVADGVLENLYKVYFEFEEWDSYNDDFRNYFVWLTEFLNKGATDFEKRVFITFESFVNYWLDIHRRIHNLNSLGDVYSAFLEEFYKLVSEDGKVHASFRSESNKFLEKYTALKNFGFIKKRLLKQSTKLFGIILENKRLNLPNNIVRRIAEMAMIHLLPFTKNILAADNTKPPFCQVERRKLPHFRSSFAEQGAQEDFFQILDDMTK